MPVVQGAGQIGIPGQPPRNGRGQMPLVQSRTAGAASQGASSNAYDLGQFLKNPFAGVQEKMVAPFTQAWQDFSSGFQGLPYGGEQAASALASQQAAQAAAAGGGGGAATAGALGGW